MDCLCWNDSIDYESQVGKQTRLDAWCDVNNVQTKTVDTSSYLEQMPVIETIHSQTLLTGPDTHIASVVETHQLGQV